MINLQSKVDVRVLFEFLNAGRLRRQPDDLLRFDWGASHLER
jgi:hypothetical protein